MDIYEELFSSNAMLNEQIIRELTSLCGEHSPLFAIVDENGGRWPENDTRMHELLDKTSHLDSIISRIDDGGDPVVTQVEDYAMVATQLAVGQIDCGYLLVFLPGYGPESTMANIDTIEMIISMAALVGRLIDKNNQLHRNQLKHLSLADAAAKPTF